MDCRLYRSQERGVALITTLLVATILLGLGLALVFLSELERSSSYQVLRERQAFYTGDVEQTYQSIGRAVLDLHFIGGGTLGDMTPNALLGLPPATWCDPGNPPPATCDAGHQIPRWLWQLRGSACKGRILPVPAASGWNLSTHTGNPFRLRCGRSNLFCECRMVLPNGQLTPHRFTLYVRNNPQDSSGHVLRDQDGEVSLIVAVEPVGGPVFLAARTAMQYDLWIFHIYGDPLKNPKLPGASEQE
ncbi:MAG: pilus assembly PilX N-terminal domain-containing protein [Acidobacteria bacterium]|nr:pilus assembly PilX N-terminal domain-containing protein [Acidobacteriota bacterium]MDW7985408.1 pilus assembly PilX N-terminal domain-containing protein [Acidobacteriota bacterium]